MPFSDPQSTPHQPTPSRRRRLAAAAAGGLAVLLAVAPFLPQDTGPRPALTPSGELAPAPATRSTARLGEVTPQMRAEIDRVVASGLAQGRLAPGATAYDRALATARCAVFEGQRYCLGVGWTTATEEEVARRLVARPVGGRETTGDLDGSALLQRAARMSPDRRARLERAELTAAARAVAKVWLLRHEIEGVPLPDGFAARHPEAAVSARAGKPRYPEKFEILDARQVRSQNTTYWCGPATMQAFAWSWRDRRQDQAVWAERLRTTTAGTAITDMVRVVNNNTGYDRPEHAGPYVALDIGDYDFDQWFALLKRHVHDYKAPVVLHPVLLKRYFPYLDDDASGHFQVGRGFDRSPEDGRKQIGYLEPWDQSKFDPSEPFIPREQWRSAYKSFRANQAHFQHNIGV